MKTRFFSVFAILTSILGRRWAASFTLIVVMLSCTSGSRLAEILFTVISVTARGAIYDPSQNVETRDSVAIP